MKNLNTPNQSLQIAETRINVERERERERKNKTFLYVLFFLLSTPIMLSAQLIPKNNLIINGDFEQFTDTPTCTIGFNGVFHWYPPTLQIGSTYFHRIVNNNWPNMNCWGSIQNGYDPLSGDGLMCIGLYATPIYPDYWALRTYIAQ
jgi:hypothetical protein